MNQTAAAARRTQTLYGFHAIGVRLKVAQSSIVEIYYDPARRDARMRDFLQRATQGSIRLIEADARRLVALAGTLKHQGVVALVQQVQPARSLDDLLDTVEGPPLLLVLDGVTDPHNLGACLRVADGAGVHAVIAPRDRAASINPVVAKAASGAAQAVPYFMVTNLARTLRELQERDIWCMGTSDVQSLASTTPAPKTIYASDLTLPLALVMGSEGDGMRQLTRTTCDELVQIPMRGVVESLNVSVAAAVCLFEALRQRSAKLPPPSPKPPEEK